MNISFSGCGFLGIYHIGVASCLKTYAPYLLENKMCGSSAGAISACCLLCDIPLGKFLNIFIILIFYFSKTPITDITIIVPKYYTIGWLTIIQLKYNIMIVLSINRIWNIIVWYWLIFINNYYLFLISTIFYDPLISR